MGGVLAIDYGERKTGFASTDALRITLQPLTAVRADGSGEELLDHVAQLLAERDVSVLLVGLPLHMDGEESERSRATRVFAEHLRARFPDVAVLLHDERLTTKEAESRLREEGPARDGDRREQGQLERPVLLEDWVRSGEPGR